MAQPAKIELPIIPPTKNSYDSKHWAEQQRIHDEWADATREKCKEKGYKKFPEPIGLNYTFYLPDKSHRDLQNFVVHGIQDGFVEAGVITDDSVHYIQEITFEIGGVNDDPKTVIRFQELNDRLELDT